MGFPIRRDLVERVIRDTHGSVDNLIVHWEERVRTRQQKVGRARNRSTVYKWLQSGFPKSRDDIFGFCSALDVDPIILLNITAETIEQVYKKERLYFALSKIGLSKLSPLWALYAPNEKWPNDVISMDYYGRQWYACDFVHEAKGAVGAYAAISVSYLDETAARIPKVLHIAYRWRDAVDGLWRPYGSLLHLANQDILVQETGDYQERTLVRPSSQRIFRTFFGYTPTEFRISSLHRFSFGVSFPSADDLSVVFRAR
jgi:hypothetical protein